MVAAAGGEATLVLPAGMDSSEAVDMAHEFRLIGANRFLVTRLEMTRRLGSVLRVARFRCAYAIRELHGLGQRYRSAAAV